MQPLCTMPGCTNRAEATFALIPLCEDHHEIIRHETDRYYNNHPCAAEKYLRPQYRKIDSLIPWSRKRMGRLK